MGLIGTALVTAGINALISAAVALIFATILDMLSETLIGLGLNLAFTISTEVMNPSTFSFKLENGTGGGLLSIIPKLTDINILSIFKTIGWCILIANVVVSVIKAMTSAATGQLTKSPLQYLVNGLFTAVLMLLIFGFGNINGLIYWFGELLDKIMQWSTVGMIGEDGKLAITASKLATETRAAMGTSWFVSPISGGNQIVNIMFAVAIALGCVTASITHIERYLSLAIYILFGPVCVAFNSSESTKDTSKQWFMGILSQSLAIILSILCWRLFFVQVTKPWNMFNLAVVLAILSIIKNSEQMLNMVGFRTMPSTDAAKSFLGAAATTAGLAKTAGEMINGLTRSSIGFAKNGSKEAKEKAAIDRDFYNERNNAKNAREVAAANNKYKERTANLKNGFKGNDADRAYAKLQQKYGNVPTAMDEIKNAKNAIDSNTATSIKNAKNLGDVENALNKRNAEYAKLPDSPKPGALSNSVDADTMKEIQSKMSGLHNQGMNANPKIADANSKLYSQSMDQIFGSQANAAINGSYMPIGAPRAVSKANDQYIAPQLEIPTGGTQQNADAVKEYNSMMLGNRESMSKGSLTEAFGMDNRVQPIYDNGVLSATMVGQFDGSDGCNVGITQLVGDGIRKEQKYAVVPNDLSLSTLPENTSITWTDPDGRELEFKISERGQEIDLGGGMRAVPIEYAKSQSEFDDDNFGAEANMNGFFTNNESINPANQLTDIKSIYKEVAQENAEEALDNALDYVDEHPEQAKGKGW